MPQRLTPAKGWGPDAPIRTAVRVVGSIGEYALQLEAWWPLSRLCKATRWPLLAAFCPCQAIFQQATHRPKRPLEPLTSSRAIETHTAQMGVSHPQAHLAPYTPDNTLSGQ